MDKVTLRDLQKRRLNKSVEQSMKDDLSLDEWNIRVYRLRAHDEKEIDFFKADHITHEGNDRRTVKDMLDRARVFLKYNLYTDDEWENIILPIINKEIENERAFVRYKTGYLVRKITPGIQDLPKDTKPSDIGVITPDLFIKKGTEAIVEYDYAAAYGSRDFNNISLCLLDEDGNCSYSAAWYHHDCWEIVDKNNVNENIENLREHHKGETPPPYLSPEITKLLY